MPAFFTVLLAFLISPAKVYIINPTAKPHLHLAPDFRSFPPINSIKNFFFVSVFQLPISTLALSLSPSRPLPLWPSSFQPAIPLSLSPFLIASSPSSRNVPLSGSAQPLMYCSLSQAVPCHHRSSPLHRQSVSTSIFLAASAAITPYPSSAQRQ